LILVVMTGIISYQAFNNPQIKAKLLFRPASVKEFGEWYRFLTHSFVHGDFTHLLINLFVLYTFGEIIETFFISLFGELLGRLFFLLVYFGAIIVAAIPSYIKHKDNGYYSALGASGGTSGIVFAFVLFFPWNWFDFPPLPGILFAVAYLWYSSYMAKQGRDNIGHDAHFWGAVFGFFATIALILIFRPDAINIIIDRYKDLEPLLAGPSWARSY
ncbi:MAG: rhomboid family intramembrane serine protease, partial [Bacteroidota bacterium]